MTSRRLLSLCAAGALAVGLLSGCSSDDEAAPTTSAQAPEVAATEDAAPVSDIEAAKQTFVDALDELGIEHSDPVRAEVGLSGATAVFDITINGYDAGINVFADHDALAAWQGASDAFGGIHVAVGTAALSLNSSDGVADSAEIAPLIAEAVGGEARGV